MRKGFKKAIASMLAVTMVLGTSIVSFAGATPAAGVSNNTTLTSSGNFEGHVDKNVVNVTLPTVSADNYNFIIDPEMLIDATNHAKYPNASFSGTTGVYFPNSVTGSTVNYTDESAKGTVTNKSSVSVNVTMAIEVTDLNPAIKMVSADAVTTGTDANLWLAVTDGTNTEEVEGTTASLTATIAGVSSNYAVSWNATKSEYEYVIKTDSGWKTADLYLQGACNTNGDWSASGLSEESTVEVTWSYEAIGANLPGGIFYDANNNWWFGLTENNGFETGAVLGDVTVNGQPITGAITAFGGEDWVLIKWRDYVAAGYDQDELEFDFTVEVNGKTYTAHYTYNG